MKKYDLMELIRDRDEDQKLRKKSQRLLTQDDIRSLVENRRRQAEVQGTEEHVNDREAEA